jgi:hypothetical protein
MQGNHTICRSILQFLACLSRFTWKALLLIRPCIMFQSAYISLFLSSGRIWVYENKMQTYVSSTWATHAWI